MSSSSSMADAFSSLARLAQTLLQIKFGIPRASTPPTTTLAEETILNLEPSTVEDLDPCSSSAPVTARLLDSLGEGGYGYVYKVHLRHHGAAALKIFKDEEQSLHSRREIINEMEISLALSKMASLKTPIVRSLHAHTMKAGQLSQQQQQQLLGANLMNNETSAEAVHCLSMELFKGGDLENVLMEMDMDEKRKTRLMTEREAASYLYRVAKAVEFCHRNQVLHLDVKPSNVLFKKKGRLETACLGDFSLARRIPSGKPTVAIASLSDTFRNCPGLGTNEFMAPEVADEGLYSPLADVFSLGCVLLYSLTGSTFPWTRFASWRSLDADFVDTLMSNVININQSEAWANLSPKAKHLITGMLCPDPLRRLNVQEVLSHPWLHEQRRRDQPYLWSAHCSFKTPSAMASGGFRLFR